jgi:multidrug efflux pump subunit AcrB
MFSGPDPMVLRKLSHQAEEIMRKCNQVDVLSVCNDWQPKGKTLYARYLEPVGRRAGLSRSDLGNALMASTEGLPVGLFYDNSKTLLINMKIRNVDGSQITDLRDIPVWSMMPNINLDKNEITRLMTDSKSVDELTDEMFRAVPLNQVVEGLDVEWEESSVNRYNGKRAIKAQCEPIEGSTPAAVKGSIQDNINEIVLPVGYDIQWLGEQKMQMDAISNILKYIPITAILILFILLLLFNNIKKLALILLCVPFAAIGIIPTLLLTGTPFTFMSIIGLLGLMGMMIKNEIVLVDEITYRIRQKEEPYQAVITSTINRTRPVVMASATTILGVLPLIWDPMYTSLAVTIMSGLTAGTVTTLILLPIFYSLFFKIHKPKRA